MINVNIVKVVDDLLKGENVLHRIIHRLIHSNAPIVERWLQLEKDKWTHYPLICSRCEPDDYKEEYDKMMRLITARGKGIA